MNHQKKRVKLSKQRLSSNNDNSNESNNDGNSNSNDNSITNDNSATSVSTHETSSVKWNEFTSSLVCYVATFCVFFK